MRPSLFSLATLSRTVGELRATTSQKLQSFRTPAADTASSNGVDGTPKQGADAPIRVAKPVGEGAAFSSGGAVASFANIFTKKLSDFNFTARNAPTSSSQGVAITSKVDPPVDGGSQLSPPVAPTSESPVPSLTSMLFAKGIDVVSSVGAYYPSKTMASSFSSTVAALPAKMSTVAALTESMVDKTATQAPQSTPELISSYPTTASPKRTQVSEDGASIQSVYPSRMASSGMLPKSCCAKFCSAFQCD